MAFHPLQIERARNSPYGLRVAQEYVASAIQRVVEMIDCRLAGAIVKIDQDVPAEDEIEIPHRSHGEAVVQIQMLEPHERGRLFANDVAVTVFDEIFLDVLGGHLPDRSRPVA